MNLDMSPKAIFKQHGNSFAFEERNLDLRMEVKIGRSVAKVKAQSDNAIFDCKVLSRNHAVIWFDEGGRFYVKDTGSSNGTFVNEKKLLTSNEEVPAKEIFSNDILQFGVEVVDSSNGSEALKAGAIYKNSFPTLNLLPPYYSYSQMLEREKQIYHKLNVIENVVNEAHMLVDINIEAKKEKEILVKELNDLQKTCDEKIKALRDLHSEMDEINDKLEKAENKITEDRLLINDYQNKSKQKDIELESLTNRLQEAETRYSKKLKEKDTFSILPLLIVILIMLLSYAFTGITKNNNNT